MGKLLPLVHQDLCLRRPSIWMNPSLRSKRKFSIQLFLDVVSQLVLAPAGRRLYVLGRLGRGAGGREGD